jgi:prepilin-type N-terminal cleavage/methylation domain-containing protein
VQIKKGFTLIEVVVSLGILAMVFAGTVTLVVSVFNLELSSRSLTEAVAIAQGKMAETVAGLDGGCTMNNLVSVNDQPVGEKYTYSVLEESFDYGFNLSSTNFIKIKVVVEWEYKGLGGRSYELEQIVRRN